MQSHTEGRTEGLPLGDDGGFAAGAAVGAKAGMRTLCCDFSGRHLEVRADKKHLPNEWRSENKFHAHAGKRAAKMLCPAPEEKRIGQNIMKIRLPSSSRHEQLQSLGC